MYFILFLTVVVFICIWLIRRSIVQPTEEEWVTLKDKECYHFTKKKHRQSIVQEDASIYLKKSQGYYTNLLAREKCVYFMLKKPGLLDTLILKAQFRNAVVVAKLSDLDRAHIYIRKEDNSLLYTSEYRGPGEFAVWS